MNETAAKSAARPPSYLAETRSILKGSAARGVLGWLTTTDPKRLSLLFLVASTVALVAAGVLRLALHEDGASSTVVAFLFLVPSLPATLGNFLLPLQLGQRRAALPHLALAGFWLYVLGAALTLAAIEVTHGAKVEEIGLLPMLAGASVLALSATLTSVNLLATLVRALVRGAPASRVSLFAWSLAVTSLAQILATVALFGIALFAAVGEIKLPPGFSSTDIHTALLANPWAYLSPARTLMLVPAVGLASDIVAAFARRPPAGFAVVATSLSALGLLTLLKWGTPLLGGGEVDHDAVIRFGFVTALIAGALAAVVLSWLATLQSGRIALRVPMLWALGLLFQLSIAVGAGLLLGVPPVSIYVHGTPFEAGYREYLLTAVPAVGFVAGVHYAWPKMTGKLYDARIATLAFLLVFLGVQASFLPDMVGALFPNVAPVGTVAQVAAWLVAAGGLLAIGNLAGSVVRGATSPENPWGAAGLEWTTTSPPPLDNFVEEPDADLVVERSVPSRRPGREPVAGTS